jgi:hypothetical protein
VLNSLRDSSEYEDHLFVLMSDNGPSKIAIEDYTALNGEKASFLEQFNNQFENPGWPDSTPISAPAEPMRAPDHQTSWPVSHDKVGRHARARDGFGSHIPKTGERLPAGGVPKDRGRMHSGPIAVAAY